MRSASVQQMVGEGTLEIFSSISASYDHKMYSLPYNRYTSEYSAIFLSGYKGSARLG